MKTAISIDDKLYYLAEETAQKLGLNRSRLFSLALQQFLESRQEETITQNLNKHYLSNKSEIEKDLHEAQIASVDFGDW